MDCTFAPDSSPPGSTTARSSPAFCREAVSAGPVPSRKAAAWLERLHFFDCRGRDAGREGMGMEVDSHGFAPIFLGLFVGHSLHSVAAAAFSGRLRRCQGNDRQDCPNQCQCRGDFPERQHPQQQRRHRLRARRQDGILSGVHIPEAQCEKHIGQDGRTQRMQQHKTDVLHRRRRDKAAQGSPIRSSGVRARPMMSRA